MATKEFIGPVDCLGAALPDEEYFMLLARDPLAAGLTMIWASLRVGDVQTALENFTRMADPSLVHHYIRNPDKAKSEEAVEVAQRMVDWRERNLKGWDGRPTWKSRRAVGVERVVLSYAERREGEPVVVHVPSEELPAWAHDRQPKLVTIAPLDTERGECAETDGDCS
jgi:hypothetical protein